MVFLRGALLQQNPSALVDDENRERAVERTRTMDSHFPARPDGAVGFVDQDQLFFGHQLSLTGVGIGLKNSLPRLSPPQALQFRVWQLWRAGVRCAARGRR